MMRSLVFVAALAACGDSGPSTPPVTTREVASVPTLGSRDLDVLLQIDDSNSTAEMQMNFAAGLPAFLSSLSAVDGELPDLHIGVITSDLGATGTLDPGAPGPTVGSPGNGGCAAHGKDGALQVPASLLPDAYLIDESDGAGGRTTNYQGTLADTLSTMMRVGAGGCGFEQPLAAIQRSFDNPANAGFRRSDANLAVIILADEDDCSLRDVAILGPESAELGPLSSFRCTRFGVECDEPMNEAGPKTSCHATVGSPHVADLAPCEASLRGQVTNPAKLVVASVVGPPAPVTIEMRSTGGGPSTPALAHVCSYTGSPSDIQVADPAVRIDELVDAFQSHGTRPSVCATDLSPALREIARVTKQMLGVACIDAAGLAQPLDCVATEVDQRTGATQNVPVSIAPDAAACPETADHLRAVVEPTAPSPDTHVEVRCRLADSAS